MEERGGNYLGGIITLLHLLTDYLPAIRADLLAAGLSIRDLGTPKLTWADLAAVVLYAPATSALRRAQISEGEEWAIDSLWSISDHLLATQIDQINYLRWELGGGKGKPPALIKRPGAAPEDKTGTAGAGASMSLEDAIKFRDARRNGQIYTPSGGGR